MPLSEQEQRLLDEMERNLYHGDGDFVATMARPGRVSVAAIAGGVLIALAGIGVLILGVLSKNWFIGVVGFAAMFAGVLLAVGVTGRRTRTVPTGRGAGTGGGFMDRLGQRWERRRRG